jgi:hypothetical protein
VGEKESSTVVGGIEYIRDFITPEEEKNLFGALEVQGWSEDIHPTDSLIKKYLPERIFFLLFKFIKISLIIFLFQD